MRARVYGIHRGCITAFAFGGLAVAGSCAYKCYFLAVIVPRCHVNAMVPNSFYLRTLFVALVEHHALVADGLFLSYTENIT